MVLGNIIGLILPTSGIYKLYHIKSGGGRNRRCEFQACFHGFRLKILTRIVAKCSFLIAGVRTKMISIKREA
jgi:hypothetical protein